jgi:hypothetical protein
MTDKEEISMPTKKTAQYRTGRPLQFYAGDEFIAAIDEWRARQPSLPGRSEAIRRLVDRGLAAEAMPAFRSAIEPEMPKPKPRKGRK